MDTAKINQMNKAEVKAAMKVSFLLDAATVKALEDRLVALTPKSNPPFPKQAELDKLIVQRDGLNDKIKAMIEEAKAGNFSYKAGKDRVQNTGRASRNGGAGTGKRGNAGDLVITVNGTDFTSWKAVCDVLAPTLVADKAAKGVEERNIGWRAEAYAAAKKQGSTVVLTFKSADKFKTYEDNGWLPDWMTANKEF